jgi:putative glutathione S-transferase
MFNDGFGSLADDRVDLYPRHLRAEIDAWNERIYDHLNNAVYKAGFATRQAVYEREARTVFVLLDELDARLADTRFMFGEQPVETDWRLFTTLVRFDAVYAIHFKLSLRRIVDYRHLWPYLRDLYQQPGIADTVRLEEIRRHYYCTHPMINPSRIVPLRPDEDFTEPAGRERVGRAVA